LLPWPQRFGGSISGGTTVPATKSAYVSCSRITHYREFVEFCRSLSSGSRPTRLGCTGGEDFRVVDDAVQLRIEGRDTRVHDVARIRRLGREEGGDTGQHPFRCRRR
jgi:hypothetical protein